MGMNLTTTAAELARVNDRKMRLAGFHDGMRDEQPAWLGIDTYQMYYAHGRRVRLDAVPAGFRLLGASDDLTQRVYAHIESGQQVFVRLDHNDLTWMSTVPGYGTRDYSLATALRWAVGGIASWSTPERDWFTGRGPQFHHNVKLVADAQAVAS